MQDTPNVIPLFSVQEYNKASLALYKVVMSGTRICILDNIFSLAAANYISDKLNSGKTVGDKSVLGVIGVCIEMGAIINKIEAVVRSRMEVIKHCDYDNAKRYDDELKSLNEKAASIKHKINKYIVD